ncbi:Tab2/Atab2 family RNA-binding protein [Pannus brasiliensis CCIBt3594]|uniref:Tab2/Atab2 family RNA-binding protein n=1 Tax=Pannus brasiliensis CCIBt3594 TaxID=1427578 RepID=A0AAW9QV58_9CHRO
MTIWELDFYSRPVVDEENKKRWEVLICETPTEIDRSPDALFRFARYCPAKTVNSLWLGEAITAAIEEAGVTPKKIRFFRRQMNNMIVKACEDIGIPAAPSRRTHALTRWLEERNRDFYPNQEGYNEALVNVASVQYPPLNAVPLPDAVRGDKSDKWAFVTLEVGAFDDYSEWEVGFGEVLPLKAMGLDEATKIPGLVIFSPRALPLAGWMSGLEMAYLKLETNPKAIIRLETGVSDSWILVNVTDPETLTEAKNFETAKSKAGNLHFLAVQSSPESESFAGFWLLQEEEAV